MNLKKLYQELIADHSKSPRNFGDNKEYNLNRCGHNPFCGDQLHIFLKLNKKKIVENISFNGTGCSVAIASASILTEIAKQKKENDIKNIIGFFLNPLHDKICFSKKINLNKEERLKIKSLNNFKKYPLRIKCVNLSWDILGSILDIKASNYNAQK